MNFMEGSEYGGKEGIINLCQGTYCVCFGGPSNGRDL